MRELKEIKGVYLPFKLDGRIFCNKNTVADTKLLGKRPQNCSLLAGQNLLFHYMRSVLL